MIDCHTHNVSDSGDGTKIISFSIAQEYELKTKNLYSIGLHPWDVVPDWEYKYADKLSLLLCHPLVVAVGEAGLDKLKGGPWDSQLKAFEFQVRLSEERNVPLIIHSVRTMQEIVAFKKKMKPQQPWIIHGFRGNHIQAQQLCSLGFYLSVGMKCMEDSLLSIPIRSLFLETDESNTPLRELYHRVASLRQISVEELLLQIKENFQKVFNKRL